MQAKLTLRLDADLIESAKSYSRESGKSLSRIVADYFALLTHPGTAQTPASRDAAPLPPLTRALRGCLKRGATIG